MSNFNFNFPIGAGLALLAGGIIVILAFPAYWLWGTACMSLGIGSIISDWFTDLAKWLVIASLVLFVLALIFQIG